MSSNIFLSNNKLVRSFSWKGANFKIISSEFNAIKNAIVAQREILSAYIKKHKEFMEALVPVEAIDSDAPDIVRRMHKASLLTGVGPMASVAGVAAQIAAEAAVAAGADEVIIENGGDIYIFSNRETKIALCTGSAPIAAKLAVLIRPETTPISICSSSSKMGHSLSFGDCDLATVVAIDGALADSASTLACNLVKKEEDIPAVLEKVIAIKGVQGVLLVKNDKIGIIGSFPEIIRNIDPQTTNKITKDKLSL
ncbi:MAG: UPF0280 family protein [Spirochaetes bacterium]|nr:UPF0280 family protein [Spirochaetota bacterium]